MKKSLVKVLIVLGIGAVLLGAVAWYNQSKLQAGSKAIRIVMIVDEEAGDVTILDKTIRTDAETLGELLDEIVAKKLIEVEFTGNKTDVYGRGIARIDDYVTVDSPSGPWWLHDSETNPDCVSAQWCSGIDQAPIYDKDLFTFSYTSSY